MKPYRHTSSIMTPPLLHDTHPNCFLTIAERNNASCFMVLLCFLDVIACTHYAALAATKTRRDEDTKTEDTKTNKTQRIIRETEYFFILCVSLS